MSGAFSWNDHTIGPLLPCIVCYEEHFCEIILNLDHVVQQTGNITTILVEGFVCSYFKFGPAVKEGMSFKEKVY